MLVPSSSKRRISLVALGVVFLGVLLNHFSIKNTENGPLLVVDEREFDLIGDLQNHWTALSSDCSGIQNLGKEEPNYQKVLSTVKAYSPPQSEKAHVQSMWRFQQWYLVELEFDDLLPSVVPIRSGNDAMAIESQSVWSGYTLPWKAAPYIRQYIKGHIPDIPTPLINCFRPQSSSFQ